MLVVAITASSKCVRTQSHCAQRIMSPSSESLAAVGLPDCLAAAPFFITTEVVTRLVDAPHPPLDCYLGMQDEAAERFMGEPHGTLWAALLNPWFEPTIVHRFRRADFDPRPE